MTDDPREERWAERLRVEPLDEVTRARLVRTAMAASPTAPTAPAPSSRWSGRARVLGIAAALVVVVAVGFAVLVRNDSDSGTTSTASRAPKAADELGSNLEHSITSGAPTLGELGDVGSPAALRQAVRANGVVDSLGDAGAPTARASAAAPAAPDTAMAFQVPVTACDLRAVDRLGPTLAVGTGTVDGAPVTVYVVERRNGSRVAVVVGPTCEVGKPVRL